MGMNALEVRRRVMLAQPHEATATGAIASFRTDVVSPLPMEFDLVPIQDLHGQDAPYPPGGGKNKFDISSAVVAVVYNSQYFANGYLSVDITKTATGISSSTINVNCGRAVCLGVFPAGEYIVSFTNAGVQDTLFSINTTTTDVLSSTTGLSRTTIISSEVSTSFTFTADGTSFYWLSAYKARNDVTYSMQNIMVRLSSVSDATYAPYSNICPITGHDGFTRNRTGVNVWDGETESGYYDVNNNGAKVDSATWKRNKNPIPCLPSTNIYFYNDGQTASGFGALLFFDMYGNQISYKTSGVKNSVVTTPANAKTMAFYAKEGWIANISVNYPASDTAYHAYQGTSIHTTFPTPPGTVYGGHVRDNGDGTGTLTVDRAIVDLSSISWTKYRTQANPDATVFTADGSVPFVGWGSIADKTKCISNALVPTDTGEFATSKTNAFWWNTARTGYRIVWGQPNGGSSKAELEQFLEDNSVVVIGPLAEPVQYTLSLTALQSLIGQNHIWVDNADSVSVEYWGH